MNLICKLINKHKEKSYSKPKYKIKDIYVGQIVIVKDREYRGIFDGTTYSDIVKKFAFFKEVGDDVYVHIKSGQKLETVDDAIVGDYAVRRLKEFSEVYPIQMRENKQTKGTKLSKEFLDFLETAQNVEWAGGPIPEHTLFGA